MKEKTEIKLNMYKAIDTVFASNHTKWNTVPAFGSAFSRFATKVAQLDLLADDLLSGPEPMMEIMRKLMNEIDAFLKNSIDTLVKVLQPQHSDFYLQYVSVRSAE